MNAGHSVQSIMAAHLDCAAGSSGFVAAKRTSAQLDGVTHHGPLMATGRESIHLSRSTA